MSTPRVTEIVIVGGGTAGWMTAAALSKVLTRDYRITLVESEDIGTVGVGEGTIPMIKLFNQALELDEAEFVRKTQASFKLGIHFVDWWRKGESYIHGFGKIGRDLGVVPFHHYWLKLHQQGRAAPLDEYSINCRAAQAMKFLPGDPERPNSPLADLAYAFHFDAGLYARFLREYSEARGVRRIEGKIASVALRGEDGFVESVALEDGSVVGGQLFIDCSGFRGLLIEETLKTGYEDWTHWLPCDRAIAVPCASAKDGITPYTRSTARPAGWQWRIPLQHRIGNGHVFCSQYMSEDEATALLLGNLDGEALAEPRTLRFTTGKRNKTWHRNVVAIGLSSGFMEPLESTSIYLIQSAIARLTAFFPHHGFEQADIDEFNAHSDFETIKIRDFLILHYHATQRDDSRFWDYCRTMDVPESLRRKMALFESNGRIFREHTEMFAEVNWVMVMLGQGLQPRGYHALVDMLPEDHLARFAGDVRGVIDNCVANMPTHDAFLQRLAGATRTG
jgi:tryptophan halogenase